MSSLNGAGANRGPPRRTVRFAEEAAPERTRGSSSRTTNGNKKRRGHRDDAYDDDDDDDDNGDWRGFLRKRQRVERRPNQDEMDDVDDWEPEDDDDGGADAVAVPTERKLLEAKRQRRLKRQRQTDGGEDDEYDEEDAKDDSFIDHETSLAAEGVEIEPFNTKAEENDGTGYFEGDTYIFRSGRGDEEPDAWLESLDESAKDNEGQYAIAASAEKSAMKMEETERTSGQDQGMDDWSTEQLYAAILPLISESETIMQAIVRYGNLIKRKQPQKQHKNGKESVETGASSSKQQAPNDNRAQLSLNKLTQASNALLLKGQIDVYEYTRHKIQTLLPQEENEQNVKEKQRLVVQWEYQGSQDGKIHGPYSTKEMLGWTSAGYFVGTSAVKVRTVEQRERTKTLQEDLLADLEDDDDDDTDTGGNLVETVRGEWQQSDQVDFQQYR